MVERVQLNSYVNLGRTGYLLCECRPRICFLLYAWSIVMPALEFTFRNFYTSSCRGSQLWFMVAPCAKGKPRDQSRSSNANRDMPWAEGGGRGRGTFVVRTNVNWTINCNKIQIKSRWPATRVPRSTTFGFRVGNLVALCKMKSIRPESPPLPAPLSPPVDCSLAYIFQ